LLRSALDLRDDRRIILYGERVLAVDTSDPQFLDRVTRAMLSSGDPALAGRALAYAQALEKFLNPLLEQKPERDAAKRKDDVERSLGRALLYQAHANFILKQREESATLAGKSYAIYPSAESARELAKIFQSLGRIDDAIRLFAESFAMPDTRFSDMERQQ